MNANGLKGVAQKAGQALIRNSPSILTGLSVAGLVTTTVMAVQATPKAIQIIDDAYEHFRDEGIREEFCQLSKKEILMLTWKCYVPAVIMGSITIACIVGANSINLRRNAALASVYSLTETALKEYQSKVVELVGEKKAGQIKDEIHKDKIARHPVQDVIITGKGDHLCFEVTTSQYFMNDIENIRKAENRLNKNLIEDGTLTLNDVYYELGLRQTKLGDDLRWDANYGLMEFVFSSQLTADGTPCLVIDYKTDAEYHYEH